MDVTPLHKPPVNIFACQLRLGNRRLFLRTDVLRWKPGAQLNAHSSHMDVETWAKSQVADEEAKSSRDTEARGSAGAGTVSGVERHSTRVFPMQDALT